MDKGRGSASLGDLLWAEKRKALVALDAELKVARVEVGELQSLKVDKTAFQKRGQLFFLARPQELLAIKQRELEEKEKAREQLLATISAMQLGIETPTEKDVPAKVGKS